MNNEEWVRSLKVGDEVAYLGYGPYDPDRILKVEELSTRKNAKSNVVRVGNTWFNAYGSSGSGYHFCHIKPLTPELRERIVYGLGILRIRSFVSEFDYTKLSKDNLQQVLSLIAQIKEVMK